MPTSTEIFINSELPKRPYTNQFPFTAGHVPVATGVGLQVEARALTASDISDISSYATQEDMSNVLADANEYADGLVVGLWDDRGAYTVNAAGNINYPSSAGSGVAGALMKGDIFTVAGAVAGISTINNIAVNNGDTVRALVDNPSATDNAHWAIAENNIGYVPENTANKTTNTDLNGATGTYPDTPTVKSYIDKYDISAASINSTGTVTLTRTASDLTFQVPTAISGLSFNASTGVLTSSYTNGATSTTITVAANEVADNVFRIKDNDDATKKIAFEASGIATGETRTITVPDSNVNLGNVAQAASASSNGYLTSADWSTFNGKQAALADVITADTYGSSTQYPVITLNAKGIATGVTLQTVPTPTFTDATFKVKKNGSPAIAASWDLSALTASVVHTYPNKAINFGDLPSVATTNSNTISSTALRCSILGGQSNNVGGTDNVILASSNCAVSSTQCTIIGSTAVTLAGTAQRNVTVSNVVLGNSRSFTFPSGTLVTGSSASGSVAHIKTFSAFRLSKPDGATVLVQDVNSVKPYAVFYKYSPSYFDAGLHRVTILGALGANNYTVRNVHVRRDYDVTVTTIEAGGGYITLSAAQNGDRLDLTVGTTYNSADTLTVFVESYYTDCSS